MRSVGVMSMQCTRDGESRGNVPSVAQQETKCAAEGQSRAFGNEHEARALWMQLQNSIGNA